MVVKKLFSPKAILQTVLPVLVAHANASITGKIASWLASLYTKGYKSKAWLSKLHPNGYIAHNASIDHDDLRLGQHVYIGDRVVVHKASDGGYVELSDRVKLYSDIAIETYENGSVIIGEETHIQPRCQLNAGKSSIIIGCRCEIAPACAIYSFNHGFDGVLPVRNQGLVSKGNVSIGNDVWLGYGVVVLTGVTIGEGAIVGANSVVTRDIPSYSIAVGNPARVIKSR